MDEQNGITRLIAMHFEEKDGKIREDEISKVVEDAQRPYFKADAPDLLPNLVIPGLCRSCIIFGPGLVSRYTFYQRSMQHSCK
jgi:hypothetical protein